MGHRPRKFAQACDQRHSKCCFHIKLQPKGADSWRDWKVAREGFE